MYARHHSYKVSVVLSYGAVISGFFIIRALSTTCRLSADAKGENYRVALSVLIRAHHNFVNACYKYIVVMGGIENFLSRLLKGKIPRYHGILPYSDFSIFY